MILKTDTLTIEDIKEALPPNCYLIRMDPIGTRLRDHAWDIRMSGSSKHAGWHTAGHKAATYDEWGWFLKALYDKDETMIAGQYQDRHDFIEKTKGEYQ